MTNGIVQLYVNIPQLRPGLSLDQAVTQVLSASKQARENLNPETLQALSACLRGVIHGTDLAKEAALAPITAAAVTLQQGGADTVRQRLGWLNKRLTLIIQQHAPQTQQALARLFATEVGHFLETPIETVEPLVMRSVPMPADVAATRATALPTDPDLRHQIDLDQAEACLRTLPMLEGAFATLTDHLEKAVQAARYFERKARIDALTGLLMKDEARRAMHYKLGPKRDGTPTERNQERPHVIWVADSDRFKLINDTYGHAFGDVVIAAVGAVFREVIRDSDVVGRFGGDEFVGLLHHGNHIGAQLFTERFYQRLANLVLIAPNGDRVHLSSSIGFAEIGFGDDVHQLITEAFEKADKALIEAKNRGRGRACIWTTTGIEDLVELASYQGGWLLTGT